MSIDEFKSGLNTNSYISLSVLIVIVTATLWINNSIRDGQAIQIKQQGEQNTHNVLMQSKIDAMSIRIDGLVTRPELEAKVSELRLEQSKLELQLLKAFPPSNRTAK